MMKKALGAAMIAAFFVAVSFAVSGWMGLAVLVGACALVAWFAVALGLLISD